MDRWGIFDSDIYFQRASGDYYNSVIMRLFTSPY